MFRATETQAFHSPPLHSPPLRFLTLSAPERLLLLTHLQQRAGGSSRQALIARAVAHRWAN